MYHLRRCRCCCLLLNTTNCYNRVFIRCQFYCYGCTRNQKLSRMTYRYDYKKTFPTAILAVAVGLLLLLLPSHAFTFQHYFRRLRYQGIYRGQTLLTLEFRTWVPPMSVTPTKRRGDGTALASTSEAGASRDSNTLFHFYTMENGMCPYAGTVRRQESDE